VFFYHGNSREPSLTTAHEFYNAHLNNLKQILIFCALLRRCHAYSGSLTPYANNALITLNKLIFLNVILIKSIERAMYDKVWFAVQQLLL